jgi:LPS export ABC transporter protein LptC
MLAGKAYITQAVFVTILVSALFFAGCENDIDKVNAIEDFSNEPSMSSINMEIVRTDSGIIIMKAFAPKLLHYANAKEPWSEFPEGVRVETYKPWPVLESSIEADYAKNWESKKLWEARKNVVVKNSKGEELSTEQLFWDDEKNMIYSEKFCRISTADGILYGKNGFEADETFSKWKLKNTTGTVNVKDE